MANKQRRALIVIPNFNGKQMLADCLQSLKPELSKRDDVLVVDNGSTDDSVAMMTKRFPWVRQLVLAENTGFTGGNNAAIPFAKDYEYFVLVSNDIEAEPGFLEELLTVAHQPGVGITNPMILDAAGQKS